MPPSSRREKPFYFLTNPDPTLRKKFSILEKTCLVLLIKGIGMLNKMINVRSNGSDCHVVMLWLLSEGIKTEKLRRIQITLKSTGYNVIALAQSNGVAATRRNEFERWRRIRRGTTTPRNGSYRIRDTI